MENFFFVSKYQEHMEGDGDEKEYIEFEEVNDHISFISPSRKESRWDEFKTWFKIYPLTFFAMFVCLPGFFIGLIILSRYIASVLR